MTKNNILKVLNLSTAHMTENDSETMKGSSVISRELGEYGWLVYIPNDTHKYLEEYGKDRSNTFQAALKKASFLGCHYILYDCDGPIDPDLPEEDW